MGITGSEVDIIKSAGGPGWFLRPGGLSAFLGLVPLVGVLSRRDKP